MDNYECKINSANDWLEKAGAQIDEGKLYLPLKQVLVSLSTASIGIEKFRKAEDLNAKILYGISIVVAIRAADTFYHDMIAKIIVEGNNHSNFSLCGNCIRGYLHNTNLREYRKQANKNIIHKMENSSIITNEDLEVVELYYNEIFKLDFMPGIKEFPGINNIEICRKCLTKNQNKNLM